MPRPGAFDLMQDVLIDGIAADGGCVRERAFQFGDGLFETIAIIDGMPCLWNAHMARLSTGCQRLHLPRPDIARMTAECRSLCAGHERAVLKIFWTAGQSDRGYRRPASVRPQRILRLFEWPRHASGQAWVVRQCAHRLSENPMLAGVKHLNRLDQVVARSEWDDPEVGEGLMFGQDGRVVCGTMSNLFLQHGEDLQTPAIEGAGIAGVVRDLALALAAGSGNPVRVGRVSVEDVRAADALYLTNSLIGVVRVGRYDTSIYDTGLPEHPLMSEVARLCHHAEWPGASNE